MQRAEFCAKHSQSDNMNETSRSVRECPHRRLVTDRPDQEDAVCGLLQDLTRVEVAHLCIVQPDACESCCKWFRPSVEHINPVVASLLFNLSSEIFRHGGVAGCDRDDAVRLKQRASDNVPVDNDWVTIADDVLGQANLGCNDLDLVIPRPRLRSGPRVAKWAVGVTTAPRDQSTLDDCLSSLAAAGWREPRLFVDGNVRLSALASGLPVTYRDPQIGAWPSYYLALIELIMRAPHADAYLLVQDDVVFFQHPLMRRYLESILWPGNRPGLVSLFCSRAYTQAVSGWKQLEEALVWGGPAIIFPHDAAIAFVSDAQVVHHRLSPDPHGLANIDWLIGEWAWRTGTPVYVPTPSLAQHIGHVSSIWPDVRAYGNRRADQFAGDPVSGSSSRNNGRREGST